MFHFSRFALHLCGVIADYAMGFPHSEISGSQVATHLPEAYRSYATSFIAIWCQGIHHTPLSKHYFFKLTTTLQKRRFQRVIPALNVIFFG